MAQAEILLIEDEATSRAILETVLSDAGYCVDTAETAVIAHSRLQAASYALVIADWLLPDGDGIYIADRAASRGSRTLVVTGHLSDLPVRTASRHHILTQSIKRRGKLLAQKARLGFPKGLREEFACRRVRSRSGCETSHQQHAIVLPRPEDHPQQGGPGSSRPLRGKCHQAWVARLS